MSMSLRLGHSTGFVSRSPRIFVLRAVPLGPRNPMAPHLSDCNECAKKFLEQGPVIPRRREYCVSCPPHHVKRIMCLAPRNLRWGPPSRPSGPGGGRPVRRPPRTLCRCDFTRSPTEGYNICPKAKCPPPPKGMGAFGTKAVQLARAFELPSPTDPCALV